MTFHLKSYPDALRQLFAATTPEETNKVFEQAISIIQKNFQLPGYRKGKVPTDIIVKSNPPELLNIVSELFMNQALDYLETQNIIPYGRPRFTPISGLNKDKEFLFSLAYEIYPMITKAPDTKTLTFEYEGCTVDEKFVEDTLCKQIGLLESSQSEVKEGNLVKIEVLNSEYSGNKKEASFDSEKLSVLIGKKLGEKLEFSFDDLSGYLPEFLGKLNEPIQVEIKEILAPKEWKSVTDSEIAEKTPFKNKEEYYNTTKMQFENIAEQYNSSQKAEALNKTLSPSIEVELPKSLWLNNLRELTMKIAENEIVHSEKSLAELSQDESIQKKFSTLASESRDGLAFVLWLDNIAKDENISIEKEELEFHYPRYAKMHQMSVEEFKKRLSKEESESIRLEIIREKAISHLINSLKFKEVSTIALSEALKKAQNV